MRIVSLVPAATEIVCALGLGDQLVGISHECDYPPDIVSHKPMVTASKIDNRGETSATDSELSEGPPVARRIDEQVRALAANHESPYTIDTNLLRALKPDLLLTQGLCGVCAVNHEAAARAADALGSSASVVDLSPKNLTGVLDSMRQIGNAAGRNQQAAVLMAQTQERWDRVRDRAATAPERPRTLLLEWTDPLFGAGHWNVELLSLAGGVGGPWEAAGKPARTLSWEQIAAFEPEMLILLLCGLDADRALDEAAVLPDAPGWFDLPAVREAECYAVDGNAYFNRPGPRLAASAEILATILHPETFTEMLPAYSVRRFSPELLEPEAS